MLTPIEQAILDKLQQFVDQPNTEQARAAILNILLPSTANLSFGEALVALRAGQKVARAGWNGRNMHLYYLDGYSTPMQGGKAVTNDNSQVGKPWELAQLEPCICMYTAAGKHQPGWLASQNDMLATDWYLVS